MKETDMEKSITIHQGHEFRTYISDIYDERDFFYDQYCQAARCISEIVRESDQFEEAFGKEESREETGNRRKAKRQALRGYPNNVIAFCSRRGNGKTSAMLSMSRALEKLSERSDQKQHEFWKQAQDTPRHRCDPGNGDSKYGCRIAAEDCRYLVMEAIDPANMEPNDSILLNILSRMYHMWEEDFRNRRDQPEDRERRSLRRLTKAFQDTYRNVYSLKKPLVGDELDEYDSLTQLSEKGDSVNTKYAFVELVESFLIYFKKEMLVIQVDDADVNTTRAYEIVEDIRKYCVGPRILVILALHLDTLRNCIEQENVKRYEYLLSNRITIPHLQGSKCREMAERYIDKLIPSYHQIHLPYIDEWFCAEKTDVNLYYFSSSKCSDHKDFLEYDKISSLNYQHRLFRLVYEKTGIILMPAKDYLHNFLPRRYRELSHFLSYFCDMEDIEVTGEGSLDVLMRTFYGKEAYHESPELVEKHRYLLKVRKDNLEKMLVYFMQYWCPISLEKEQIKIIQEIFMAPLKLKCQKTIDLLHEYCKKLGLKVDDPDIGSYLKSPVEFPDDNESISYAQIIDVLNQFKKKLNIEHKFEFVYAIQLYYSICMNQSVCVHLEKGDGFSEIIQMTGERVFSLSDFYMKNLDRENDFICVEFLRRMLNNHRISPTEIGWDHCFKAMEVQDGNLVEKQKEDILIKKRMVRNSQTSWIINPEIEWIAMDFNQALFYLIGNRWIYEHSYQELSNGKENAYEGVSSALQIICNFDYLNRIRKYVSYPVGVESVESVGVDKQIRALCKGIKISSLFRSSDLLKKIIEEDSDMKSAVKEMQIKNPPVQYLRFKEDLIGSIVNELLDVRKENNMASMQSISSVPVIIFMLTCASPRRSVFIFFQFVEDLFDAIGRKKEKYVNRTDIFNNCLNVWDNYKNYLEYLVFIESFRDLIKPCQDFLKNIRKNIRNHINRNNSNKNNSNQQNILNQLSDIQKKIIQYMKIRSAVLEESQKTDLLTLTKNLKNCDWLTKKIKDCHNSGSNRK